MMKFGVQIQYPCFISWFRPWLLFALLCAGFVEADVSANPELLRCSHLIVPEEERGDFSTNAVRMLVRISSEPFMPIKEMSTQHYEEEYRKTPALQNDFPSGEDYIATMLRFEEEEKLSGETESSVTTFQLLVSLNSAYARYIDEYNSGILTQEVIQLKHSTRPGYRQIIFDHREKTVREIFTKAGNDYSQFFLSMTPQASYQRMWQLFPRLLQLENMDIDLAETLCDQGSLRLSSTELLLNWISDNRFVFTRKSTIGGKLVKSEYELEKTTHLRILRYSSQGEEISEEITYQYDDPSKPWPISHQYVSKNILSRQTLMRRSAEVLGVVPSDTWDFQEILERLRVRYKDYTTIP